MASPPRVVLAGKTSRILCVADIRGDFHELNRLIREHEATAVIHTGDFGFINAESLDRMSDKILKHLIQYSPLLTPATRNQLLSPSAPTSRSTLITNLNNSSIHFPLSQFPHLLSGAITFSVPVFTVWGLIEDVRVLERFRTGEYEVTNLNIVDEATSRLLEVGGLKLRLFGLGGAVAGHKLFDNGEGYATIAGGQGTMWTTALQIGELVDTALQKFDPTETRLLLASAAISRNGLLSLLSNALKADLTISGGLHFRYPASFNEFAVHADFDGYHAKLQQAKDAFEGVYNSVKDKVDSSMSELQLAMMKRALSVTATLPPPEDPVWQNTWHWVLSDASCGHMVLSITDGRVSAETKSTGLNFSHRAAQLPAPPSAPTQVPSAVPPQGPRRTSTIDTPTAVGRTHVPPGSTMRPPPNATAGIPPRPPLPAQIAQPQPPTQNAPPPTNNNMSIRGLAARPPPVTPAKPPTGPAAGVQVRPAAGITRQPRGPGGVAGGVLAGANNGQVAARPNAEASNTNNAVRPPVQAPTKPPVANITAETVKPPAVQSKPSAAAPTIPAKPPTGQAAVPPKPPTGPASIPAKPAAPGKASTTATPAKTATPAAKPATGAQTQANGKPTTIPAPAADLKKEEAKPKAESTVNGDKPAEAVTEKKKDEVEVKKEDVSESKKDETSTPDSKDAVHATPSRKPSLWIRGIPVPTTEQELKDLFPAPEKIVVVKVLVDRFKPPHHQKDYAYIDFANEEDMQEGLKGCKTTLRGATLRVDVSNPPPPRYNNDGSRGGRGGMRGTFRGRGGGRGGFNGPRKEGEGGNGSSGAGGAGGGAEKTSSAPAAAVGGSGDAK